MSRRIEGPLHVDSVAHRGSRGSINQELVKSIATIRHSGCDYPQALGDGKRERHNAWESYETAVGELRYNSDLRTVVIEGGEPVRLTPGEAKVFGRLLGGYGQFVSHADLRKAYDTEVYEAGVDQTDQVKFAVFRLRARLGDAGKTLIISKRMKGYALAVPEGKEVETGSWESYKTAVGEVRYDRGQGVVVIGDGKPIDLIPGHARVFERLLGGYGQLVSHADLRKAYDPEAYEAGVDQTDQVKFAMHRLRARLGGAGEELITNRHNKGYAIALPEGQELGAESWESYETAVGEVRYNSDLSSVVIEDREPIKLAPREAKVFERLLGGYGQIVAYKDLLRIYKPEEYETEGIQKDRLKYTVWFLRNQLGDAGKKLIVSDRQIGYGIALPEEQEMTVEGWQSYTMATGRDLKYNPKTRRVVVNDGDEVKLRPKESVLFDTFLQSPGQVFSWRQLINALYVYGTNDLTNPEMAVKGTIHRLRRALGDSDLIQAHRGLGYSMPRFIEKRETDSHVPDHKGFTDGNGAAVERQTLDRDRGMGATVVYDRKAKTTEVSGNAIAKDDREI